MVNSPSECCWNSANDVTWIKIITGLSGSGNGTISYAVSENNGACNRIGRITVGGESHTVNQDGKLLQGNCWLGFTSDWTDSANWSLGRKPDRNDFAIFQINEVVANPVSPEIINFNAQVGTIVVGFGKVVIGQKSCLTLFGNNVL